MDLYRHGDIDFVRVEAAPADAEVLAQGTSYVVAEGEATGHHHLLTSLGGQVIAMRGFDERVYIEVRDSAADLTHQEHQALRIEPGVYEIRHEREWDYYSEDVRQVLD